MEVLYEESALNQKSKKNEKIYNLVNVVFWIAVVLSVICFAVVMLQIPFKSPEDTSEEFKLKLVNFFGTLIPFVLMLALAIFTCFAKRRVNLSYDYTFVSGELRIARVSNVNKRKFLYEILPEEILQVGDVEGESFERLLTDPNTKLIVCTANNSPAEGKFFMYVLAKVGTQKQLYLLECREELLLNILKFVRRGTLEDGYVAQAKKAEKKAKDEARARAALAEKQAKVNELDEQELLAMRAAGGIQADAQEPSSDTEQV